MDIAEERVQWQNENQQLKEQLAAIKGVLQEYSQVNAELVSVIQENSDKINNLQLELYKVGLLQKNMKYELWDEDKQGREELFFPHFRSDEETLRLIKEERKSLARFGDGEFSIAAGKMRCKFQRVNESLGGRILEVLQENQENLLIGIAKNYGDLGRYNEFSAFAIREYMNEETRDFHQQILSENRIYSDAYITRPYVMFKDVFTEEPRKRFEKLKSIWESKNIIVVEGAQSRLGMGNDLFAKAKKVERILAPATDSYDRYDDILKECLDRAGEADMFLLAIGPSSGILAYDLTKQGVQAVDVGHIDLEYEWFLAGEGQRVPVPHKYNNEIPDAITVDDTNLPQEYMEQIVADFSE